MNSPGAYVVKETSRISLFQITFLAIGTLDESLADSDVIALLEYVRSALPVS